MGRRFLSEDHILAAEARAAAGDEPWVAAMEQLVSAAEEGLDQPPLSVRDNGGSPHFFRDICIVLISQNSPESAVRHNPSHPQHPNWQST